MAFCQHLAGTFELAAILAWTLWAFCSTTSLAGAFDFYDMDIFFKHPAPRQAYPSGLSNPQVDPRPPPKKKKIALCRCFFELRSAAVWLLRTGCGAAAGLRSCCALMAARADAVLAAGQCNCRRGRERPVH